MVKLGPQRPSLLAAAVLSAALTASPRATTIAATDKLELTPADAVATVRVMQNQVLPGDSVPDSLISPDGHRYVVRLSHGDVARNGVWVDLLTGSLDSLAAAAKPVLCAHLLTTGLGSPRNNTGADFDPQPSNILRWLNNQEIAFLWSNRNQTRQVVTVDLVTCRLKFLTSHATHVLSFGVGTNATLIFNAKAPPAASTAKRRWAEGFTVSDTSDGWSILQDDLDGVTGFDVHYNNEWFLQAKSGAKRRININGRRMDPTNPAYREIDIDPDGRFALTDVGLPLPPLEWRQYTDASFQTSLDRNAGNPNRVPLAYAVLDLRDGSSRQLWNAPLGFRTLVAWGPRKYTALLAPTFLPLEDGSSAGRAGTAAAVVDVGTGRYQTLPVDLMSRMVLSADWISATEVQIDSTDLNRGDGQTQRFELNGDRWISAPADQTRVSQRLPAPAIRIETRQTLNDPPKLFAVDPEAGKSVEVADLNPNLVDRFKLGRVERVSGTLPNGLQWLGQLIYPADYDPGRKYPLVIQSLYGKPWAKEEYSLDGSWGDSGTGLGPSTFPVYPGQLLATRDIAVLELEVLHPGQGPQQARDIQFAFEALAEQFASSSFVDRNKIALDGFSRNGYWVEFTLSHSKFPFAAAVAADNYDPSYMQSALSNWRNDDVRMNGAPAFGPGLQDWLTRAPGFSAEHIQTPLLMVGQSYGLPYIMSKWETYSRLRHLRKPVEMYLMPGADLHPSHTPQNPRQIMAIQERVIDWLTFWLTGREDHAPGKRLQYIRWRALRELQALPQPQL